MALLDLEVEQPKKKLRITIKCGQKRTTHEISYPQKRRHYETTKTTATIRLAEFLKSIANDDILFEIFTRLPNARAALHCSAVCKRWRSVISYPHFVPTKTRHHQNRSPPFTLMLGVGHEEGVAFRELFSEDSKTLHGVARSSGESEYLDFLPPKSIVRASNKDLLLVTPQQEQRRMWVCNPLTRQWVPLPEPPPLHDSYLEEFKDQYIDNYALVCDDPNSEHHHFTVVVSTMDWKRGVRAAVFRSETGRWDESFRTFRPSRDFDMFHITVGTIDWAIYTPLVRNQILEKIAVFDPFDATTGLSYREILLPRGFKRGWRAMAYRCRIGAVRGRLRLWQSYFDKTMDKFMFKMWKLNEKYGQWVVMHDLRFAIGNESKFMKCSTVLAVHPHEDDVFFFDDDNLSIWEYHIGAGSCKTIGEIDNMWRDTKVYTVVHQPWPTVIPQIHSI